MREILEDTALDMAFGEGGEDEEAGEEQQGDKEGSSAGQPATAEDEEEEEEYLEEWTVEAAEGVGGGTEGEIPVENAKTVEPPEVECVNEDEDVSAISIAVHAIPMCN